MAGPSGSRAEAWKGLGEFHFILENNKTPIPRIFSAKIATSLFKMKKRKPLSPSEGERRASVGYYSQYTIAAALILRSLRSENLQWIKVADPEAGSVDDIQIGASSFVDAFQIKWSGQGGNISFKDIIRGSREKPSLIAQLADGWSRLRLIHHNLRIRVHLLTNKEPSTRDHLLFEDHSPQPNNFAAFLQQAWKPARAVIGTLEYRIPKPWHSSWEALQRASGLNSEEFNLFIKDCEFDFGFRFPGEVDAIDPDQQIFIEDLKSLSHFLHKIVADSERIVELSRDQLLTRLGWKARVEFRSRHEFPVDEVLYEPIVETVRKLENTLATMTGGYLAVIGSPGSGKSSLLTQTLRYRDERIIRYYAYVPDALEPTTLRGESKHFLHDIVLAVEQAGFRVGESISRIDRDQLLGRLHDQLQLLHKDWLSKGLRTIILVDGLDHISREQHPERSLLKDLPLPEQVPQGVIFLLGSQSDADLPDRIQAIIRQPDRRIEMNPLSREEVFRIFSKLKNIPFDMSEWRDQIYTLSDGHPLALAYLLNKLQEAKDKEEIKTFLDSSLPYRGNIEEQYHSYWKKIEKDTGLAHLLGLLSRLRGVIDLSWVETWPSGELVRKLRRDLSHYFRREGHDIWYFFHNSFRVFLQTRTAESSPGIFDPSKDCAFHRELADQCSLAPGGASWSWDELYHRIFAKDSTKILKLDLQELFRRQFVAFRPIDAIQTDVNHCMRIAASCSDIIALTRLIMAGAEFSLRKFNYGDTSFVSILFGLGLERIGVEHLRDGNRLRISPEEALQVCLELNEMGFPEEARRLFELAEPLDLLAGINPLTDDVQGKKRQLLEAWARGAVYFRDIGIIINRIRKIRRGAERFKDEDPEENTHIMQNKLLYEVGLSALHKRDWIGLSSILGEFNTSNPNDCGWWFWLHFYCWQDRRAVGDRKKAEAFLDEVMTTLESSFMEDEERVILAEGIYLIKGDKVKAGSLLEGIDQPKLKTDLIFQESSFSSFLHRFRLNRLRYVLGNKQSPADIIPDPDDPNLQGLVFLERAVCLLSRIFADAWNGQRYTGPQFAREFFPLLRLFNVSQREGRLWTSWYVIQNTRESLFNKLVQAAALHGPDAVEALREALEHEWDSEETKSYWPPSLCRSILLTLNEASPTLRQWIINRLKSLENNMFDKMDVYECINEGRKQAQAWIVLGEKDYGNQAFKRMVELSFGIGYRKDYQLDSWIEWLGKVNTCDREGSGERISWFARALLTLNERTEGRALRQAAKSLISVTFGWNPGKATELFHWLLEQKVVSYEEGLRALLNSALKAPSPPLDLILMFILNLLMPISTKADPDLVQLLLEKVDSLSGSEDVVKTTLKLLTSVQAVTLPSTRLRWRRGIARTLVKLEVDLGELGLTTGDIHPRIQEDDVSESLVLSDGSRLCLEELIVKIKTITTLQSLVSLEKEGSYFNWVPIVKNLAGALESDEVLALVEVFRGNSSYPIILSILSERLSELGHSREAWQLGDQALRASTPFGWDYWHDRGSRFYAFRALVRADPLRARPQGFKTLVEDLTGDFPYPQNVSLNLDEILPILADKIPIKEIWSSIEEYVRGLIDEHSLPQKGPWNLEGDIVNVGPRQALVNLLITNMDHPINVLLNGSQRILVKLLQQSDPETIKAIQESLAQENGSLESLMANLDAASLFDPNAIAPFYDQIIHLGNSVNYAVRNVANSLFKSLNISPPLNLMPRTSLPDIYNLVIPTGGNGGISIGGDVSSEKPLPDYYEPDDIVKPYDFHIGILAEEAKLPFLNMCYRVVQIMHQLSLPNSWSFKAEKKLRDCFGSIDLHFPFRRKRAIIVRQAMFHLIAELADSGALTISQLGRLDWIFRYYDPAMLLHEPISRPNFIRPIKDQRSHKERYEEWLNQVKGAIDSSQLQANEGLFILGEETTLKRLEPRTLCEVRRNVISPNTLSSFNPDQESDKLFGKVINKLVCEYPKLNLGKKTNHLIIHQTSLGFDTPGDDWLALNPQVGYKLGWKPSNDGWFRWEDAEGNIMVESLWWADGYVGHSSFHLDNEVGEGWVVVTSSRAWEIFKANIGHLKRLNYVQRYFIHNDHRLERDLYSEQDV